MDPHRTTQAEDTAGLLQLAAGTRVPIMIPGALDMRVGRPTARPNGAIAQPAAPHARVAAVDDRERLEREREGGGAPSERAGLGHRTLFAKLYDLLVGRHHAP